MAISGFSGRVPTFTRVAMLNPIAYLILQILNFYEFIVVAAVIVSWLTAFNVINQHNNFVRTLLRILLALTEPVFRQIRKVVPPVGGLDLSPIIVFLIIWFLQYTITWAALRYAL
jgi:YggT family protein